MYGALDSGEKQSDEMNKSNLGSLSGLLIKILWKGTALHIGGRVQGSRGRYRYDQEERQTTLMSVSYYVSLQSFFYKNQ